MGNKEKRNNTPEIIEKNLFINTEWHEHITVLDLTSRDITNFDENVKLPLSLTALNLSKNKFTAIPIMVLKLEQLKTLDLSFNIIVLFDETPSFCHTIENLNLSNNQLEGPPYWVWTEKPKNLVQLNLSNNNNICNQIDVYYLEELLQYTTLVNVIELHNCRINKRKKILSTFKHAKVINLGHNEFNYMSVNHLENVPCDGLEDCCDIEVLNVCNTHIYNVQHNIDVYKNLREMNLSQNYINSLPNEFCNLNNLEVCILSYNNILYLPDDVHKLTKLVKLLLDNNQLCMIPNGLIKLSNLKMLDLYNNHLYGGIDDIAHLEEYDFGQNYVDEPNNDDYLERKRKLRRNTSGRLDGSAPEVVHEEYDERSDEESAEFSEDHSLHPDTQQDANNRCSSPEDWDSDEYWVPSSADSISKSNVPSRRGSPSTTVHNLQWLNFVKRKMAEGNFCPMDMHLSVSISEKVSYEKRCNPQPEYESDGQFDDFSDDDT